MKTFHHQYKLKKDTPIYKAGWPLRWSGSKRRFYFLLPSTWKHDDGKPGIYSDFEGQSFTVEQVQDREWFEPVGPEVLFIPAFPSENKLEEYVDLLPTTRMVDDVDECRAINMLLEDKGFQKRLYVFYKEQYKAFHGLK